MNTSLYHYTNLSAVLSILKNNKIWMTDIRYLNDTQELHDGIDSLLDELQFPYPSVFTDFNYYESARKYIIESLTSLKSYGVSEDPLFLFSLSSEPDSLSQWRAYGYYAIEFDKESLALETSSLCDCVYIDAIKKEKAGAHVRDAIATISNDMAKNDGCPGEDSINALIDLSCEAATFKHYGFVEEKESRIILQSNNNDHSTNVQYRPKSDILIPYIEVPITLDCIKSITIGPIQSQNIAFVSMSEFVNSIQEQWKNSSLNIEYELLVRKSAIPFRA